MKLQRARAPVLAFALGALVWIGARATEVPIPYAYPAYFILAMTLAGAASAWIDHRRWWAVALALWLVNPVVEQIYCVASEGLGMVQFYCLILSTLFSIMFGLWVPGLVGAVAVHLILHGRP